MKHIADPRRAQAELLAWHFERRRRTARHPFHQATAQKLRDIYARIAGIAF